MIGSDRLLPPVYPSSFPLSQSKEARAGERELVTADHCRGVCCSCCGGRRRE